MKNKNKALLSASVVALLTNTSVSAESNPFKSTNLKRGYENQSVQLASSSMHGNKKPEPSCGASHMKMNDGKCGGSMGMSDKKKEKMQKHMENKGMNMSKDKQIENNKDE